MPNHVVFIILDSCRYDSFVAAATPNIDRLGKTERRFSYASWTSPSHAVMLMGLMPHSSPSGVVASEVYKKEYKLWIERLGVSDLSFRTFVPQMSLPKVLKDLGYETIARVSMPVLNPYTVMSRYFDDYQLMEDHNDFAGMVSELDLSGERPRFYFFNLGETHYPYMLPRDQMPHLSGLHGTLQHLDTEASLAEGPAFDAEQMQAWHRQQIRCVEHVDGLIGQLFTKCPPQTWFIITADHGELFGEDGYFGHGPIHHEKVLEVPFVEGQL